MPLGGASAPTGHGVKIGEGGSDLRWFRFDQHGCVDGCMGGTELRDASVKQRRIAYGFR